MLQDLLTKFNINIDPSTLIQDYVIPWGINITMAIAIFIVGRIIVGLLVGLLGKVLSQSKLDVMLVNFVKSIVKTILLLFVIVASLNQLGVDTTSLVALLGAAGLAIGLSLQGSLQNFAAGVMLLVFRPFKQGDFVEVDGVSGVVKEITIFTSKLTTPDNKEVIIPNGNIYGNKIINYSAKPTRRIDFVFGIGYDDDLKQAKQILTNIVNEDERVLKDPAPVIAVTELADSSVNFAVRPWVKTADYWDVYFDITERVKIRFDEENIGIPYPQMDLHVKGEGEYSLEKRS